MPKVYMYPNPDLGKIGPGGVPETSVYLADPHVAHLPGVEGVLRATAATIAARSAGRLATVKALSDRSAGPLGSFVEVQHGYLDYYVVLNDERSDKAAAAIEKRHGILASAAPSPQGRFARRRNRWDNQLVKDPVKGGYPDAP